MLNRLKATAVAAALSTLVVATNVDLKQAATPTQLAPTPKIAVAASQPLPERQATCLARAVWHEARGEPHAGQVAVVEVILARTAEPKRFRRDACAVIRQPGQFSFVRGGRIPPIPDAPVAKRLLRLVQNVAGGRERSPFRNALFFHAASIDPEWNLRRLGRIGGHIFYRDATPRIAG